MNKNEVFKRLGVTPKRWLTPKSWLLLRDLEIFSPKTASLNIGSTIEYNRPTLLLVVSWESLYIDHGELSVFTMSFKVDKNCRLLG